MWAVHSVVLLPIPVSPIALTILIMPTYPGVMVKIKLDFKCFAVREQLHTYINSYPILQCA